MKTPMAEAVEIDLGTTNSVTPRGRAGRLRSSPTSRAAVPPRQWSPSPPLANPLSACSPACRRSPTRRGASAPPIVSAAAASTKSPTRTATRASGPATSCTRRRERTAPYGGPDPAGLDVLRNQRADRGRTLPSVWTRGSPRPASSSAWSAVPSTSVCATSAMAWSMCGPRRATATCAAMAPTGAWWTTRRQVPAGERQRAAQGPTCAAAVVRGCGENQDRAELAWRAQARQKVDIDRSPALAQRFQVVAVPTLVPLDSGVGMSRRASSPRS